MIIPEFKIQDIQACVDGDLVRLRDGRGEWFWGINASMENKKKKFLLMLSSRSPEVTVHEINYNRPVLAFGSAYEIEFSHEELFVGFRRSQLHEIPGIVLGGAEALLLCARLQQDFNDPIYVDLRKGVVAEYPATADLFVFAKWSLRLTHPQGASSRFSDPVFTFQHSIEKN